MTFKRAMWMLGCSLSLAIGVAGCTESAPAEKTQTDLTIFLTGELWQRGGAVIVHPIPVPQARWRALVDTHNVALPLPADLPPIPPGGKRMSVVLDRQFGDVQFLYPEGRKNFTFRFRPHPDHADDAADRGVRLLSIGGVDGETGMGEPMTSGFTAMPTSGTQIFHIVAPETNERAARVLAGLGDGSDTLECAMTSATGVCVYPAAAWAGIAEQWATQKRKLDREYRRMEALDHCYDSAGSKRDKGTCEGIQDAEGETTYTFRLRSAS
jgi:hypothetical protein